MTRSGLPFLLVAVLTATLSASASSPPLPAHNGWIAFASDRSAPGTGRFGIYRLDPVGARVSRLGVSGRQPAWSPDGTLIALVQDRFKLVIARADGKRVAVLRSKYPIHDPAWSPDGSQIVLRQVPGWRFQGDLVLVDVTTMAVKRVTHTRHDDSEPAWSPDGAWIAFVSNRDGAGIADQELYLVHPNGRGLRPLTSNDFTDTSPAWSPDGSRIAFVSGRVPERLSPELWTMDSNGDSASRLQPASAPGGFPSWSDMNPAWSPDGRWLVYVTTERWGWDDIFIVEVEGGAKFDLTPEATSFDWEPAWQPVCIHAGTARDDVLRGTSSDELICGYGGNDAIAGGNGKDRLFGGSGDDRIRALDVAFDVIGCGAGRDIVRADSFDLVGVDCENVRRR